MTNNQIQYRKELETERANREQERLKGEENAIKSGTLSETMRANRVNEGLQGRKLDIDTISAQGAYMRGAAAQQTANIKASELGETIRHNAVEESWYGAKYGTDLAKDYNFAKNEVAGDLVNLWGDAVDLGRAIIDPDYTLSDWAQGKSSPY